MKNHPIQPLEKDQHGTLRFKRNKIVEYLLNNGGIDMNRLTVVDFPAEDREQFAQLIGYSLSGFGSLSYVSDETVTAAQIMSESKLSDAEARVEYLEETLLKLKEALRKPMAELFRVHPDDLNLR